MDKTSPVNDMAIELGKQIRIARVERGMSQLELIEKTGLGDSTVRRIEKGTRDVTASQLQKIASALGMRMSQLGALAEQAIERRQNS